MRRVWEALLIVLAVAVVANVALRLVGALIPFVIPTAFVLLVGWYLLRRFDRHRRW